MFKQLTFHCKAFLYQGLKSVSLNVSPKNRSGLMNHIQNPPNIKIFFRKKILNEPIGFIKMS